MVKPGIILPSERHDDICKKTNDGFKGQDEFGVDYPDATMGSNTVDGKDKGWDLKSCRGLSVFWIANIANFFSGNAAVGGHAGVWSFSLIQQMTVFILFYCKRSCNPQKRME